MSVELKISKGNYGNYSSDNYSGHCQWLRIGDLELYFSYNTVIAFIFKGELVIRKNDWSTTTGKHLNWIDDDKKKRIDGCKFVEKLNSVVAELGLDIAV